MPFTIPNAADAAFSAQAAVDKVDVDAWTSGSSLTGVLSGCAASVTGSDMVVSIGAGQVISAGSVATVTAGTVTIGTANATNPRFDLVVSSATGTLSVVAGTAASSPAFPAIPAGSVLLHVVYVPANDTSIQSNQITDKRLVVRLPDDFLAYSFF